MKTGVVCRKLRWVGGKDGHEVEEYEINTALIESLNSVERRAAIETGQEVDHQDIQLGAKSNQRAELLAKAFSLEELEAMKARMIAAAQAEDSEKSRKLVEAPAQLAERKQLANVASQSPVKLGPAPPGTQRASPKAAPAQPGPGAALDSIADDAVEQSVPPAPKSWRG